MEHRNTLGQGPAGRDFQLSGISGSGIAKNFGFGSGIGYICQKKYQSGNFWVLKILIGYFRVNFTQTKFSPQTPPLTPLPAVNHNKSGICQNLLKPDLKKYIKTAFFRPEATPSPCFGHFLRNRFFFGGDPGGRNGFKIYPDMPR